jgi:hypothetical protein
MESDKTKKTAENQDMTAEVIELNADKMFDMLPAIGSIYTKLDLTKCIVDLSEKYNEKGGGDKEDFVINSGGFNEIINHVAANLGKVKPEFFEIVAIAAGISVDEAKNKGFGFSLKVFMSIFKDKDLTDFFKQAIQ